MSLNIGPEKIVRTRKGSDGDYHSEIYSFENWLNGGCFALVLIFAISIAIAPVAGLIFLVIYCLNKDEDWFSPIVPLITSIYLLIDIKKGWIASDLMSIFYGAKGLTFALKNSITTIIVSLLNVFFGNQLYAFSNESNSLFLFLTLLIYWGCYLMVSLFF